MYGWCLERKDYRLFKLNRMDCVVETNCGSCVEMYHADLSMRDISGWDKGKALFTPNMKWRLVEEFGPNCFTERTMEGCSFQQTTRIWKLVT